MLTCGWYNQQEQKHFQFWHYQSFYLKDCATGIRKWLRCDSAQSLDAVYTEKNYSIRFDSIFHTHLLFSFYRFLLSTYTNKSFCILFFLPCSHVLQVRVKERERSALLVSSLSSANAQRTFDDLWPCAFYSLSLTETRQVYIITILRLRVRTRVNFLIFNRKKKCMTSSRKNDLLSFHLSTELHEFSNLRSNINETSTAYDEFENKRKKNKPTLPHSRKKNFQF
jgi:hypothetical protein